MFEMYVAYTFQEYNNLSPHSTTTFFSAINKVEMRIYNFKCNTPRGVIVHMGTIKKHANLTAS